MAIVLPIYLDQPGDGCILPLIDFAGPAELQGLGDPPLGKDLEDRVMGESNSHLDARLSVGLFGMGGIDSSPEFNTRSFEWVASTSRSSKPNVLFPGVGYRVTWGAGYRIHLQSNSTDFDANVGQATLAFKTRVKGLQTSFAAETFGVQDHSIYGVLPAPDGFDPNTCAIFERAASMNLADAIGQNRIMPVPIGMTFDGDIALLAVKKARAVRLAAQMVLQGRSKEDTLAEAIKRELPTTEIDVVYKTWFAGNTPAADVAQAWLRVDSSVGHRAVKQSEIDGMLPTVVESEPIAGADSALSVVRTIVRSQLMSLETSTKAGYGAYQGSYDANARRLVFEIFTRQGPMTHTLSNGVAHLNALISGLMRVNCLQSNIESRYQASFSGVSADAALNQRAAQFDFVGHGYDRSIDQFQLTKTTDANAAPDRISQVGAMMRMLADDKLHQPTEIGDTLTVQVGTDQNTNGFPDARTVIRALEGLRDGDSLAKTRGYLSDLQLDPNGADAIMAAFSQADARNWLRD